MITNSNSSRSPSFKQKLESFKKRRATRKIQQSTKELLKRDTCAICLTKVNKGAKEYCYGGHKFHDNCIEEWLKMGKDKCPQCSRPITEDGRKKEVLDNLTSQYLSKYSADAQDKLSNDFKKVIFVKLENVGNMFVDGADILSNEELKSRIQEWIKNDVDPTQLISKDRELVDGINSWIDLIEAESKSKSKYESITKLMLRKLLSDKEIGEGGISSKTIKMVTYLSEAKYMSDISRLSLKEIEDADHFLKNLERISRDPENKTELFEYLGEYYDDDGIFDFIL
jgi:hypothetical protein